MRLDHLLSMETMTDHHGSVGVGMEETGRHGSGFEDLLLFSFQGSDGRKRPAFFERRKPFHGGVAQLGEHLPCKQGVMGSIPIISTSGIAALGNRMAVGTRRRPVTGKKCRWKRTNPRE